MTYDFCVIGGGIVGLATACAILERRAGASLVVLEKEDRLAKHQTGHNSGVIHSGIYYTPGSLKAQLCREGAIRTKEFCKAHDIPYEDCGKLLVATNPAEEARMEALYTRSVENDVEVERVSQHELRVLEPEIAGVGALRVPITAIVDFKRICEALADDIRKAGGDIRLNSEVVQIRDTGNGVGVEARGVTIEARQLVVCPGIQADRLARAAGLEPDFRMVPFRGEYYRLAERWEGKVRHLIYPIPDPELPFLGIHLTNMIDGSVTVGPNAMLGMAREGYPKFSFDARDVADYVQFPGFWKMLRANLGSGLNELRNSVSKARYLQQCRKYCPGLELEDLQPMEAGIRAQAVGRDGTLIHDFLFLDTERALFVCNAPSPAATSALPIGARIAERLLNRGNSAGKAA